MAEITERALIVNELGLHARAASKLVQLASKFNIEIQVGHSEMMVNAKSIMGVLMLAAAKGTELSLVASGDDETCRAGLDALTSLIADRFGEER